MSCNALKTFRRTPFKIALRRAATLLSLGILSTPAAAFPSALDIFSSSSVIAAGNAAAHANALAEQQACRTDLAPLLAPWLSGAYLRELPTQVGRPQLLVAYYDTNRGLFAGYQSFTGKRILLRAMWRTNGSVNAEVAHLGTDGNIEAVIGRRRQEDRLTGQRSRLYVIQGVDLLAALRRKDRDVDTERLAAFLQSDVGQAFTEAVPALYAMLESMENDSKLSALQAPFGAILGGLQLKTGIYGGFEHADAVLGTARAEAIREICIEKGCRYRGRYFQIHESGLFDSLGKHKEGSGPKRLLCADKPLSGLAQQSRLSIFKNGDGVCTDPGSCFGMCGPGCFTPGDIWTPECFAHDLCVCKWGHEACLTEIPTWDGADCHDCGSLMDAIAAYLAELLGGGGDPEPDEELPDGYDWWNY